MQEDKKADLAKKLLATMTLEGSGRFSICCLKLLYKKAVEDGATKEFMDGIVLTSVSAGIDPAEFHEFLKELTKKS